MVATTILPSPADLVARALNDLKVGTDPSENGKWPVYVTEEPDKPDDVITIIDTQGTLEGRLQISGVIVEKLGIQIRIRSVSSTPKKPQEIRDALDQQIRNTAVIVSGTTYTIVSVSRTSNIIPIGSAPLSSLNLFTINAQVTL